MMLSPFFLSRLSLSGIEKADPVFLTFIDLQASLSRIQHQVNKLRQVNVVWHWTADAKPGQE